MQEGAYPKKKKKKSVSGQFAAVEYRSETYCWTKKVNREDIFFAQPKLQSIKRSSQSITLAMRCQQHNHNNHN